MSVPVIMWGSMSIMVAMSMGVTKVIHCTENICIEVNLKKEYRLIMKQSVLFFLC